MAADPERYSFEAEWYDKVASTLKKFYLIYFPTDNSVELIDLKVNKTFLKRIKCDGVETKDFYVGAVVRIFSRSMKITNFADKATEEKLSSKIVRSYTVLKPTIIDKLGEIICMIVEQGFDISNIKMGRISYEDAMQIFKSSDNQSINFIEDMTSGPVTALQLLSKNGAFRWQELTDIFEKNGILNSNYIPNDKDEGHIFFTQDKNKSKLKNSAKYINCTCCIIKPHAFQARLLGPIVSDIQKANFNISAIQQFYIEPVDAEEFLEVYKGVLPDYAAMVNELQSGPCVVIEITHDNENVDVVREFRKLCGPMDPEMAKQLRPNSLRAKYGKSKVQNAVHCSDLSEDGLLEVEYFFKILDAN